MNNVRIWHPRYWLTWIGVGAMRLISLLPLRVLWLLGVVVGELGLLVARRRRHIALRNIERCFPERGTKWHRSLLRRHFHSVSQSLLSMGICWWASPRRLRRIVQFTGREHYDAALSAGRSIVLLCPHFVSLDLGIVLCIERPLIYMYKKAKNPVFDAVMRGRRMRLGAVGFERDANLRGMIRKLRDGLPLIYLPDQNPGRKRSVFAPFFGIPTATFPALGRFAEMADAVVIPCLFRQRRRGAGYEVIFRPPMTEFPTGEPVSDARRINEEVEKAIAVMPEQYVWGHRRFKVRPSDDEADFYAR